jgi:thiol-disulfide isomerase/thioredoxin
LYLIFLKLKHLSLKNKRKPSKRYNPETNKFLQLSLKYLENEFESKIPSYSENDSLIEFYSKIEVVLIDKSLYSSYASKLISNISAEKISSNSNPFIVLVDTKNESLHLFTHEFNYNSISQFMQDHLLNLNKRYDRSRENFNYETSDFHNILDVDIRKINSILGEEKSKREINDLLIFFYNNWCGFCKSLNFNLVVLMQKYFSQTDTLKLLKVNIQDNDLPLNLYMQHIPTLLLIPANLTLKESIIFNYPDTNLDKNNLLDFILMNSHNTKTLKDFMTSNFLNAKKITSQSKQSKLRYDFINLVEKKIKNLERKAENIEDNRISFVSGIFNSNFDINFDKSYIDFTNSSFDFKFNKLKEEIYILKEFQNLFNKKIT